jgi:hypothetical protein
MNTLNKLEAGLVNAIKAEYDGLDVADTKGIQTFQIRGVEAVNKLVAEYNPDNLIDHELIGLVLGSLVDLQVRDYSMGITNADNLNKLNNLWAFLTALAPEGDVAPVATLWAITHYEMGNTALALEALDIASSDNSEYSLTKLIARVISAGWPTESFQAMRNELHTKILAGIYETN